MGKRRTDEQIRDALQSKVNAYEAKLRSREAQKGSPNCRAIKAAQAAIDRVRNSAEMMRAAGVDDVNALALASDVLGTLLALREDEWFAYEGRQGNLEFDTEEDEEVPLS